MAVVGESVQDGTGQTLAILIRAAIDANATKLSCPGKPRGLRQRLKTQFMHPGNLAPTTNLEFG